jgi:uncharacterized protein
VDADRSGGPNPATPKPAGTRFQVLALDGGGVRGIFTAAILAGLEEDTGRPVVDHFDLVVGTSTGGVVALGLGARLTPRQILDFYLAENRSIFSNPLGMRRLRQLLVAKYRPKRLQGALQRRFGETVLGDSAVPLVIPSFNLGENAVYIFKTPHHPRLKRDYKVPVWAVAMATSAAPTYFPAFHLPGDGVRLIDGGVWANNPAMVGVTEAVSMFGQRLEDVRVLSLGTTSTLKLGRSALNNAGILRWGFNAVDVFLDGQSAGAFAQVEHLVGKEHARRLNPPAPEELASLDSCDANELIAKAAHYSRQFTPDFDAVFGSHIRSPYTPFHGPKAQELAHVLAHH